MYDTYLAGLAMVKGAGIRLKELKFLIDVMSGQNFTLFDFIEEGTVLMEEVSYRLHDEGETYNEKWRVDVKKLYDKLKSLRSLPLDVLSALSVRIQLFWFEDHSPVKKYSDVGRIFRQTVNQQEKATTTALEDYFDQKFRRTEDPEWANYLVNSLKTRNVIKESRKTLVGIVFDYLKAFHPELAMDLWMTSSTP